MRKRKQNQPVEGDVLDEPVQEKALEGELVTGPREYTLEKPIT